MSRKMASSRIHASARAIGVALLFAAHGATAAEFTVTTLADAGAGSLRAAVAAANAAPDADTIRFQVQGTVALASGAIGITAPVAIEGCAGCAVEAADSRVFEILGDRNEPRSIAVALRRLRLSGSPPQGDGGAIQAEAVRLQILDSVVHDSHVDGWGGALYADNCEVAISGSRFEANSATGNGGAVASSVGRVLVDHSVFADNRAGAQGGALWANWIYDSAVRVASSTLRGNGAGRDGGAISAEVAELHIEGSTFEANVADYWAGGALYLREAGDVPATIDNSTFVGNQTPYDGGQGAAILLAGGRLVARHLTVSGNVVGNAGGLVEGDGGAVAVGATEDTHLQLVNSIVAGNHRLDGTPHDLAREVSVAAPNRLDLRYSLVGAQPDAGTVNGTDVGNRMGIAPLLGDLADHGGPTQTQALLPGSPACDAAESLPDLATDQRGTGFARAWKAPDMGAWEYRADTLFIGDFELHAADPGCTH